MLAGASRSTPPYVCALKTCSVGLPAGQVVLSEPRNPGKWTVPSWLPCRVGSAAGRRSKFSSGCVTEGDTCGVHAVGPFGLLTVRPRSLSWTPNENRARAVIGRSSCLSAALCDLSSGRKFTGSEPPVRHSLLTLADLAHDSRRLQLPECFLSDGPCDTRVLVVEHCLQR